MHERIIFIDLSLPISEIEKHSEDSLIRLLKKHEQDLINGSIAPPAYVFITNHPYHYDLEDTNQKILYLAEGFNIPNFGKREVTLREAIQARKQHQPIHDLWDSIKTHTNIPVTFDGELPEFAFSKPKNRLLIGQKYLVNLSGTEQLVELQQATVDIQNQKAWGLCKNSKGLCQLIEFPLTKEELKAYKQSPDTFFGVYRRQGKMLNTPLEMYDFFMQGFSQITKEKLLEHLKAHPSYQELLEKNRDELLEIYCANITNSTYLKQPNNPD